MFLYHSLEEFVDQPVAQLVVQQFLEFLHWQLDLQDQYQQYVTTRNLIFRDYIIHPKNKISGRE